mmetsp:Transcript_96582/g.171724  ORF Transcript_96582/g.171724 Transcript_96582/m.171724 type:complete len:91 (+) Transcript_96582:1586-1858(+)
MDSGWTKRLLKTKATASGGDGIVGPMPNNLLGSSSDHRRKAAWMRTTDLWISRGSSFLGFFDRRSFKLLCLSSSDMFQSKVLYRDRQEAP